MSPINNLPPTWLNLNTERIFRSFMENTPTMTWILDEKSCFRYMNSSYMKTFGLSETAIGRSIYEFYPAELTEKGITADGSLDSPGV